MRRRSAARLHAGGWLLLYANIAGYSLAPEARVFGIEAALLDRDDPRHILGRTFGPLLQAEAPCEMRGFVPRVAFPSGALVRGRRRRPSSPAEHV